MDRNEVYDNSKRRKFMYASFIREMHGFLGKGERRRVPRCDYKYVGDMFPPPEGEGRMGHREA